VYNKKTNWEKMQKAHSSITPNAVLRCYGLSVCLSNCLSHTAIVLKWLSMKLHNFHIIMTQGL